jgi:hypothetical protein
MNQVNERPQELLVSMGAEPGSVLVTVGDPGSGFGQVGYAPAASVPTHHSLALRSRQSDHIFWQKAVMVEQSPDFVRLGT